MVSFSFTIWPNNNETYSQILPVASSFNLSECNAPNDVSRTREAYVDVKAVLLVSGES